jgi:uncharacterized protein DUF4440
MTTSLPVNVGGAERAWAAAFVADTTDDMRALLHPDFVAVHGPAGHIRTGDLFLADADARPRPISVQMLTPTVHEFGDTATVGCIQQLEIPFIAEAAPFILQAAVTRVWIRSDQHWKLAHLQMSPRTPTTAPRG